MESLLFFALIGILGGTAAGFIGIGGGVIMVPVLLEVFRAQGVPTEVLVHVSMGTSVAVASLSSVSSAFRHHRQGNVLWRVAPILATSSFAAGLAAGMLAQLIPGVGLQRGLAVVLLLAAFRMFADQNKPDLPERKLPWWGWTIMGVLTGVFSGFTGLAGGLFLIPLMAFIPHVPTRKLAGTSSGVVMFTAFAAALGKILSTPTIFPGPGFIGHVNVLAALALASTSIPSAQLGAWLNRRVGSVVYKRIFAILLMLVVIRLFWTS
ncbi:sulfite exporter TauE/SafE family protein [bacterium]|nr:sulfite exporter TauE/SafE family protein [bacterium]